MAQYTSSSIVRDGLVFHFDANNSKSWRGQPTTNILNNPDWSVGEDNNFTNWTRSDAANISFVKSNYLGRSCIKLTRNIGDTGYDGIRGTFNTPLLAGTTYTETITYAVPFGMTQDLRFYLPEYINGVINVWHHYLTARNKTNGWQTFTQTFTTSPSATSWGNFAIDWNTPASTQTEEMYIQSIQLEVNPYSTPFVNGTRSNTQTLLDLTGQNTVTATILTYNSDGTFSFNGSSNYLSTSSVINTKTVIAWIKLSTVAGGDYVVYGPQTNGSDNWFGVNANKVYLFATQTSDVNNFSISGTTTLGNTSYYQIAATIDTNTAKVYLNGEEENTTTQLFTIGTWNSNPNIGRRGGLAQKYFPGTIGSVYVYDRVLSQAEIKQNFNALRGRYGV